MKGTLLGLDIGYGNLKLVFGRGVNGQIAKILPSGVARADQVARTMEGKINRVGHLVNLDGVPYVAAVSPTKLQGYERILHQDYASSPDYLALFYAALLETRETTIDTLVTGLPVAEHLDHPERIDALQKRLVGTHYVNDDVAVVVRNAHVLPQPVGTYLDALATHPKLSENKDATILVVDPGYYSVDWVVMTSGGIRHLSSGSSPEAASRVLERASKAISAKTDCHISVDRLNDALAEGRRFITVYGERYDYQPALKAAAAVSAEVIVNLIKSKLRSESMSVDSLVVSGGTASLYAPALEEAFPRGDKIVSTNSVLANARGFHRAAVRYQQRAASSVAA
jgi:plasmid segregation protein ParM